MIIQCNDSLSNYRLQSITEEHCLTAENILEITMCKTSVDSVGALALSLKDTYIIIRTEWFGTIRDVSIRGRVTLQML